jgi:hypothetical protein
MEKYQRPPYSGILKEAGRDDRNSWRRSGIKEAGGSWNELRFIAADRQKWKGTTDSLLLQSSPYTGHQGPRGGVEV